MFLKFHPSSLVDLENLFKALLLSYFVYLVFFFFVSKYYKFKVILSKVGVLWSGQLVF